MESAVKLRLSCCDFIALLPLSLPLLLVYISLLFLPLPFTSASLAAVTTLVFQECLQMFSFYNSSLNTSISKQNIL